MIRSISFKADMFLLLDVFVLFRLFLFFSSCYWFRNTVYKHSPIERTNHFSLYLQLNNYASFQTKSTNVSLFFCFTICAYHMYTSVISWPNRPHLRSLLRQRPLIRKCSIYKKRNKTTATTKNYDNNNFNYCIYRNMSLWWVIGFHMTSAVALVELFSSLATHTA